MHNCENKIEIGFWRPLRPRSEWVDRKTPVTITARIPSWNEDEYARYLAGELSPGSVAANYGPDVLERAGVASVEELLRLRAEEGRVRSEREFMLPIPIPGSLDPGTAMQLAKWLRGGAIVAGYMGMSTCRICGAYNGSTEWTLDQYLYPEGLVHYVEDHSVAVPGLKWPPT